MSKIVHIIFYFPPKLVFKLKWFSAEVYAVHLALRAFCFLGINKDIKPVLRVRLYFIHMISSLAYFSSFSYSCGVIALNRMGAEINKQSRAPYIWRTALTFTMFDWLTQSSMPSLALRKLGWKRLWAFNRMILIFILLEQTLQARRAIHSFERQ